ncbi:hypothetical protein GOP47_0030841, partial [Adiantum capillus-veneris]
HPTLASPASANMAAMNVCFCGRRDEDVHAWVVEVDMLLLELDIFDDVERADFMYERLYEDAWHFYECLLEQVQYSWKLMKYALLKYYACSKMPARGIVYFCGTASECIQSWITPVEHEMMRLAIDSDVAEAAYASQGLSHDAFMFLHMLPNKWRYS